MTARSSGPSTTGASVVAPSATIEATAMEEAKIEGAGKTATLARSGKASLVRVPGEISLVRTVLRVMSASLQCHHHQEGTTTTTRTRGPGASRSLVSSLAS